MSGKATLIRKFKLESAHQLPHHDGKCRRLHGHTYNIEVFLTGEVRSVDPDNPHPKEGMVVDFGQVDDVFNELVYNRLDHQNLNDQLKGEIPRTTAEYLSAWILAELRGAGLPVSRVRVWETARGAAEVAVEDLHKFHPDVTTLQ